MPFLHHHVADGYMPKNMWQKKWATPFGVTHFKIWWDVRGSNLRLSA